MIDLEKAFLFAQWIGERKYTKHQCNDRWYDSEDDYYFIGSTEDLWNSFNQDSEWLNEVELRSGY